MAQIKRSELQEALKDGSSILASQVFLFFGERFLCKQAADMVQEKFLAMGPGAVHAIDGDREDGGRILSRLTNFSLLPGRQLFRVTDTRIFHSRTVAQDIWAKAALAFQNGNTVAAGNYLLSLAQAVDLKTEGPTPLSEIPDAEWQKIFAFDKPDEPLQWADQLLADAGGGNRGTAGGAGLAERYIQTFEKGLPAQNILLLTAETVDKRQKLFTCLKKIGTIVDCSVVSGAGTAAQTEQKDILREMMLKTLAEFGKKIEPQAVEIFFERVGFHPVAIVIGTEKLAHSIGDRPVITGSDVEENIARNSEDALYELTDAIGRRRTDRALQILANLLEQGIHELAILATLRNYLRRQLIFRALQMRDFPVWRSGMNARDFQNTYLPALKAEGEWSELLQGHPYALFMSFTKASEFSCPGLKRWLTMLLDAEYRLKGSPLPSRLVLEELLLSMLKGAPKLPGRRDSMVY